MYLAVGTQAIASPRSQVTHSRSNFLTAFYFTATASLHHCVRTAFLPHSCCVLTASHCVFPCSHRLLYTLACYIASCRAAISISPPPSTSHPCSCSLPTWTTHTCVSRLRTVLPRAHRDRVVPTTQALVSKHSVRFTLRIASCYMCGYFRAFAISVAAGFAWDLERPLLYFSTPSRQLASQ